jgi:hypothetical protein
MHQTREEANAKSRERYYKNREKRIAQIKAYRLAHREESNAYHRKWLKENREKANTYRARWKMKHPDVLARVKTSFDERHPGWQKEYDARWKRENPAEHAARQAAHRALRIMAQPPWVKREDVAAFYVEARRQSLITGIPHEVDHIWPLHGNGFVGLHVSWNLRIIPKAENNRKRNKRPDQLEVQYG